MVNCPYMTVSPVSGAPGSWLGVDGDEGLSLSNLACLGSSRGISSSSLTLQQGGFLALGPASAARLLISKLPTIYPTFFEACFRPRNFDLRHIA